MLIHSLNVAVSQSQNQDAEQPASQLINPAASHPQDWWHDGSIRETRKKLTKAFLSVTANIVIDVRHFTQISRAAEGVKSTGYKWGSEWMKWLIPVWQKLLESLKPWCISFTVLIFKRGSQNSTFLIQTDHSTLKLFFWIFSCSPGSFRPNLESNGASGRCSWCFSKEFCPHASPGMNKHLFCPSLNRKHTLQQKGERKLFEMQHWGYWCNK